MIELKNEKIAVPIVLIAGLISAVVGERDFHHKGPDHHDDLHAEVEH